MKIGRFEIVRSKEAVMDYKKFHQTVVLAYINNDPNMEKFGKEVVEILNEFRSEEHAAQQNVQAYLGWTCAVCQSTNLESDLECGYCDTPRPSR